MIRLILHILRSRAGVVLPESDIFLPTFGTDLQYAKLFSASKYRDAEELFPVGERNSLHGRPFATICGEVVE
jgi:hypothetical protein